MAWIKNQIHAQLVDCSNVQPWFRFDVRKNRFYLNSCAGLIEYRPRKQSDIARFRDTWINRFEAIRQQSGSKEFFELYGDILSNEKVKYKANLRTRLKCSLYRFT